MSTLTLVRHAQASFFEADYDRLSDVGQRQAQHLGAYWLRRGIAVDEVFTGPRVRQARTAELVGALFTAAGTHWPQPVVLPELDEHAVDRLIKGSLADICREYPRVADLAGAYEKSHSAADKHRTFQKMFEAVVLLWVEGVVEAPGVESWRAFSDRVRRGIERITRSERRGRRVAAFTSVGAITVALQVTLGCSDRTALDLGWRVRNCSLTELVFTKNRLTLEAFNSLAHLKDPGLWTYR